MTSGLRRGPSTAMPSGAPSASMTRPPSARGSSRMSRRIRLSMLPPRMLCQAPPADGDHPEIAGDAVPAAAERHDQLADACAAACCGLRRLQRAVAQAQHGNVGGRVAAGQRRCNGAAVRQSQRYVVVGLERIAGRDHGIRLPDEAAGHEPAMRSNADDGAGCVLDQPAQTTRTGRAEDLSVRASGAPEGSWLPG